MTPSTPAPATSAPFIVALSKEKRADLASKAAALKTLLATATAFHAQPSLSPHERRNLERAVESVFVVVRAATQTPMLDHIAGTLESALAPLFRDAQLRRKIARQSDLYRNLLAVFACDKHFRTAPTGDLLRFAAAWLEYAEGLLAGKSIQELALLDAIH